MAFNVCPNQYAKWHINESSGTNVPDDSGNGRDGTTVNSPTWAAGKLNNCLTFSDAGSAQYVNCGDIANFERTTPFSLEMWFKIAGGLRILISRMTISPAMIGWEIFINGGQIFFYLMHSYAPANYINRYTNTNTYANNAWHHVIVTYDGSSTAAGIKIYMDGSQPATTVTSDTLTLTSQVSTNMLIGQRTDLTYKFNGSIDETAIYDRVLTQDEVTARYKSGAGTELCTSEVDALFYGYSNLASRKSFPFSGEASLVKTEPRAFQSDSNLMFIPTVFFYGDSSLLKIIPGQITGDALLQTRHVGSFLGDTSIARTYPGSFTGSSHLYDNDSKFLYGPWAYGGLFGGIVMMNKYTIRTFTSDAALLKVNIPGTFTSEANLFRTVPGSFTGDTNIKSNKVLGSFLGDANLKFVPTVFYYGDSNLRRIVETIFTGHSYITFPSFTSDSNLAGTNIGNFSGDSIIVKEYLGSFTGDGNLTGQETSSFSGDSSLRGTVPETFKSDASLKGTSPETFTGDAAIKTTHVSAFSGDSSLVGTTTAPFAGDASILRPDISVTFTGQASLRKEITNTVFTGNASLQSIEPGQFTGGAYFDKMSTDTFAGSVIMESLPQYAGFSGTVDCISVSSSTGWGLTGMDEFGLDLII